MSGGKRGKGGKWEERQRPWILEEEDCIGRFWQQGGVWDMKHDTGVNTGAPAWDTSQDRMYCAVCGFGMFRHILIHPNMTSCCAEYDLMLCWNMSQVVPDQQKSLMEFPCSKNPSLFNIKEGPLPPQSNFSSLTLSDKEFVLIYQLVALVVVS